MAERGVAERTRLTYEDFCALPDDGKRYEILDGDLYMSPSPRTLHQRATGLLYRILSEHVETHGLGEVFIAPFDVVLSKNDIVEPDVIFVSTARRPIITDDNIRGVPDLLVEVVSPTRPAMDTRDKRHVYERCRVPFYWIVDPDERRVTELRLTGDHYETASEPRGSDSFTPQLFPDLTIELERLWA